MSLISTCSQDFRDFVQFLPDERVQKEELARIARLEESRKASETKSKRAAKEENPSGSAAAGQKRKAADDAGEGAGKGAEKKARRSMKKGKR